MYQIILAALLLLVPISQAQQEVAFVHGINSDPSTWSDTRAYIGNRFAVSTRAPGYSSNQSINSITANQVRPQVANGSILVGHSMGGL
jgi:pimeloyl-ACP methyl ester carboxylesterase